MAVCNDLKTFSRRHERIADFFSLLAVAVLFGTIWIALQYYQIVMQWVMKNPILHGPLLIFGLVATVLLVLGLLAVGSARFGEEDERCFGTFRGRRGGGSPIDAFRNWVQHMENVGKRHR